MVLDLNGELWQVQWFQHHKPGKGNTVVRSKLKHVLSGKIIDKTFNSDTKVDTATIDRRDMQYLYLDGEDYVFMDNTTYDQVHISADVVGEARFYLLDNQSATVAMHEGIPLFIELARQAWNSRSPTPNPACRGTGPPEAPNPPPWKPARRSRSRCSSPRARRSRSTLATDPTSPG